MQEKADINKISQWEPTLDDYRDLFQKVPCYISVQNRDLRIVVTNELFQQDFGENRIGELCYEVYKRRDKPCTECPVQKTFETGKVHTSEEHVITRNGQEVIVVVYTSPVKNSKGEIIEVMEMITNITYIKKLQTELTMMGQAIASMAHGIKNILTGLDGGIYMVDFGLNQGNMDEMLKGWDIIKRNVDRISTQVKDILYCAKKRDHKISTIDPCMVAKEIFDLFHDTASLDNTSLVLDIDEKLGKMSLNAESLHTVLSNLVHNSIEACKFDETKKDHEVKIRAFPKGPLAIFEISDNGPGIPEEWEDSLFRKVLSTKDRHGTGLGLLVTKKIVDELGGQITFSTKNNSGTTFRVTFPIK